MDPDFVNSFPQKDGSIRIHISIRGAIFSINVSEREALKLASSIITSVNKARGNDDIQDIPVQYIGLPTTTVSETVAEEQPVTEETITSNEVTNSTPSLSLMDLNGTDVVKLSNPNLRNDIFNAYRPNIAINRHIIVLGFTSKKDQEGRDAISALFKTTVPMMDSASNIIRTMSTDFITNAMECDFNPIQVIDVSKFVNGTICDSEGIRSIIGSISDQHKNVHILDHRKVTIHATMITTVEEELATQEDVESLFETDE